MDKINRRVMNSNRWVRIMINELRKVSDKWLEKCG